MTWEQTLPILIPAFGALVVCVASHQFAAWRDRENKRREQRVSYLASAYRALAKANHHPRLFEVAEEVEQAVADIQFLGTPEQIKLAQKMARDLGTIQEADMDGLLFSLRDELRRELGLSSHIGPVVWLKISKNPSKKER